MEKRKKKDKEKEGKDEESLIPSEILEKLPAEDRSKILRQFTATMALGRVSVGNPLHEKITEKHIDKIIDGVDRTNDRIANDRKSTRRYVFYGALTFLVVFVGLLVFFKLQGAGDTVLNLIIGGFSFVGGIGGGFALSRFV